LQNNTFRIGPQIADPHGVLGERLVLRKSQPRGNKEQAIVSNAERRSLNAVEKLALRVEHKRLPARDFVVP